MFELKIKTGNAAFHNEDGEDDGYWEGNEVCRILDEIRHKINRGYRDGACVDYYGNTVGRWGFND